MRSPKHTLTPISKELNMGMYIWCTGPFELAKWSYVQALIKWRLIIFQMVRGEVVCSRGLDFSTETLSASESEEAVAAILLVSQPKALDLADDD